MGNNRTTEMLSSKFPKTVFSNIIYIRIFESSSYDPLLTKHKVGNNRPIYMLLSKFSDSIFSDIISICIFESSSYDPLLILASTYTASMFNLPPSLKVGNNRTIDMLSSKF